MGHGRNRLMLVVVRMTLGLGGAAPRAAWENVCYQASLNSINFVISAALAEVCAPASAVLVMQLSTLKLRATYQLLSVNGLIVDDRS